MTSVLFLLSSGFFYFTLASNRLRSITHEKCSEEIKWEEAKYTCKVKNGSLVTLYDEEDARFIDNLTADKKRCWLGLHKSRKNVSIWSNGVPFTFNMSKVNVRNEEQICEAIENNTWKGFNCSDRKPFMCYRGKNFTLIEKETKNWCGAQHYCRKHFTDLVSISNKMQNDQVIKKGKNQTFWIGLMHDKWEWEDKGCSTYREWDVGSQSAQNCTRQAQSSEKLYKHNCGNIQSFLCSTGNVRIKIIQKNLTWEQTFDYCKANHSRLLQIEDEDDQKAVEKRLNDASVTADSFWIGLRQSRVFGFWIWSDKTVVYNNWKNNRIPEMPRSNNCGVIKKDINNNSWSWSDENCWRPLPFLCEEEISYMLPPV